VLKSQDVATIGAILRDHLRGAEWPLSDTVVRRLEAALSRAGFAIVRVDAVNPGDAEPDYSPDYTG
jgi:chorismate synthase